MPGVSHWEGLDGFPSHLAVGSHILITDNVIDSNISGPNVVLPSSSLSKPYHKGFCPRYRAARTRARETCPALERHLLLFVILIHQIMN